MSELALQKQCAQFLGVYQHFYTENVTEESFSTHYIVLAYEITFDGNITDLPIAQHNEYNWFTEAELLKNTEVHEHSKWYFQETKEADYNFCS
jgi:colanic acid biosynthesis protein WcaH